MQPQEQPAQLQRAVGLWGAVMLGLGSILGTGIFVSIGIAAGVVGPAVLIAVLIGALVAAFNGLSSAQLAANHRWGSFRVSSLPFGSTCVSGWSGWPSSGWDCFGIWAHGGRFPDGAGNKVPAVSGEFSVISQGTGRRYTVAVAQACRSAV